jgi:hypothetical protein
MKTIVVVYRCRAWRSKQQTTSHTQTLPSRTRSMRTTSCCVSFITTKQTDIPLSYITMPASPGDPSEWENFSWTPAEEPPPVLSSSSSESSVSNITSVYDEGGVGRISYTEWLRRHPGLPRRPQYGLLRMIVLLAWGLLADVKQKFIRIWRWIKG